jgi:protein involved in sex pheromone biosynthesis
MKKHIALGLVASTIFLAGCCTSHKTAHWEYKTQTLNLTAQQSAGILNANAKDGWEFVSATPITNDPMNGSVVVFKRRTQ